MFKVTLAGLLAHKLRMGLTAFSIILGVAFACATLILSNALQATFDNIFNTQQTAVAVVVRGHVEAGGANGGFTDAHRPVSAALVDQVKAVPGVDAAQGIIFRGGASLLDASGKPYRTGGGAPEFATNWVGSSTLSPYHLRSGSPPTTASDVVVDAATAKADGIVTGQHIQYVINGGPKQDFVVSGIAGYGTSDTLAGATISLFTTAEVQQVFGLTDKFDQIDVGAQSGLSDTELRDRIAAKLPSSAEAITEADALGQQKAGIDTIFSFVRIALLGFALIALFAGSFIIVNTFNILITQRTRELGLLRALGASRGQVFRSVVIEALITGLGASLVGVAAGVLLAHGIYALISATSNGLPPADLILQTSTVIIGVSLGTIITLGASLFPARKATQIAPVAAIREAGDSTPPLGKLRLTTGILLVIAGAGMVASGLFGGTSGTLPLLGFGAFLLFIGVALLAFLTVMPIVGTLGLPIAALPGIAGKLARLNAIRSPRRAASTAAGLMIGVTFVVAIAVLTASAKESTRVAVQDSIKADYIVLNARGGNGGSINTSTTAALAKDSHFSTVDDIRFGTILVDNSSASVLALDPATYPQLIGLDPASGDPASLAHPNTMFIDEQQAADHGWKVGDTVQVTFPQNGATVPQRIGCIFNSNALLSGFVISKQTYTAQFPEPTAFAILLRAASGVSHADGLAALNRELQQYPTLKGFDTAAFLALQAQQLDQLTTTIDIFLVMAILIAALGIVNTLALSVIERTREIGLLRAIGLSRGQTWTMIAWESILISFLGLVLGSVLGIALGIAVVHALASTGIGHVAVPWAQLLIYAVAAFVIGLVASVLPGLRAGRLNILDAISTE